MVVLKSRASIEIKLMRQLKIALPQEIFSLSLLKKIKKADQCDINTASLCVARKKGVHKHSHRHNMPADMLIEPLARELFNNNRQAASLLNESPHSSTCLFTIRCVLLNSLILFFAFLLILSCYHYKFCEV